MPGPNSLPGGDGEGSGGGAQQPELLPSSLSLPGRAPRGLLPAMFTSTPLSSLPLSPLPAPPASARVPQSPQACPHGIENPEPSTKERKREALYVSP